MTIQSLTDTSALVGSGTYTLSTVPQLTPGVLADLSVTRSTTIQGMTSTFTIQFTTPGYLLNDAFLEIQLPLNQITVAMGKTDYSFADPT